MELVIIISILIAVISVFVSSYIDTWNYGDCFVFLD